MKKWILSFVVLAVAATACKKDDPASALPAATQDGRNTAGCLIDGQAFTASGFGSGLGKVNGIGGGFAEDSALYLRFSGHYGNNEGAIHLFLNSFPRFKNRKLVGRYLLNTDTPYMPSASPSVCQNYGVFFPNDYSQDVLGTTSTATGYIDITRVDEQSRIVAGTFEFTGVSYQDPKRTIRIVGGRFDRKQ